MRYLPTNELAARQCIVGAHGSAPPKLGYPRRLGARRGRLVLRIGLIFARLLSVGYEQQAPLDRDLVVSIGIRHGDIEAAGNARDHNVL